MIATAERPDARAAEPANGHPTRRPAELPSRDRPRGGNVLQTLFDASWPALGNSRGGLGSHLSARYDGDLFIPLKTDRPTIVANFVETVDGVVALDAHGETGGGEVSGFNPSDRFVMGVLRSLADVVLVGAATVRASGGGVWTGPRVARAEADAFHDLRARLGLTPNPTTLVVTASGDVDPAHPGLSDPDVPVVIAAPAATIERLTRQSWAGHVRLSTLPAASDLAASVVALAAELGAQVVLSEAGPDITAELLRARAIDELFLTVSPQLAGRAPGIERLSLVEGEPLWPADPRWLDLVSVRRGDNHLFLRYRFEETNDVE